MNLFSAEIGKVYTVKQVNTFDDELNSFLFSLGCYCGAPIAVVSKRKSGMVVAIKDARYSIDNALAKSIDVE